MEPITLTFRDPKTGEPTETFTRAFVPWAILKWALRLQNIDLDALTDEDVENINSLVVAFYDSEFTVQELQRHASFDEVIPVFLQISSRINTSGNGNPTLPGARTPARQSRNKRNQKTP
jgi:hypothetical protein